MRKMNTELFKPFDPEEAQQYERDVWAEQNVAAAAAMGMGEAGDEHMAQPVSR